MIANVSQLLRSEVGTARRLTFDEMLPALDDDIRLNVPVRGSVELIRTNRGILIRGHFTTTAEMVCSRCLDPAPQQLTIKFSEEYLPVVDIFTGLPTPPPPGELSFLISEKHELDLSPAIREYGLLELPMQPLCRIDCQGLCPHCGVNRNVERCRCLIAVGDGRFDILKALLPTELERN